MFERTEKIQRGELPGAGDHANLWKAIETANIDTLREGLKALDPEEVNALRCLHRPYDPFKLSMLDLAVLEGLEPAVRLLLQNEPRSSDPAGQMSYLESSWCCNAAELCCAVPYREGCMQLLLRHPFHHRNRCDASLLTVAVLCNRPRIIRMLIRRGDTDEVGGELGRLWVVMWLRNNGYPSSSTCPAKASSLARLLARSDCLAEFGHAIKALRSPPDAVAARAPTAYSARSDMECALRGIFEQERKRNQIKARLAGLQIRVETAGASALETAGSSAAGGTTAAVGEGAPMAVNQYDNNWYAGDDMAEPLSRQCKEQIHKVLVQALTVVLTDESAADDDGSSTAHSVVGVGTTGRPQCSIASPCPSSDLWYRLLLTIVQRERAFERGFDINMCTADASEGCETGYFTLLSWAASLGLPMHVLALLEFGADARWLSADARVGPLHSACHQGWISIAALLLRHGADVDQKDVITGATPTNMAIMSKRVDTIRLLLDSKADALRMKSMNNGTDPSDSFFLSLVAGTSLFIRHVEGTKSFEIGEQRHEVESQIAHFCRFAYMERSACFQAYRARGNQFGPEGKDEHFEVLLAEEKAARAKEEARAREEAAAAATADAMAAELIAEDEASGGAKPAGSRKSKKKKNGKAKGAAAAIVRGEAASSEQGAGADRTAADGAGANGNADSDQAGGTIMPQSQRVNEAVSPARSHATDQAVSHAASDAARQAESQSASSVAVDVSEELLCPITTSLFVDPVVTADGQTYEREAIEKWFASGHGTAPLTGEPLAHTYLTPNLLVRSQCVRLREQYPQLAHSMS